MNKRRIILAVFLLCALVCIGLGYAALTDSIALNGNITTVGGNIENSSVFNVEWKSASIENVVDNGVTGPSDGSFPIELTADASVDSLNKNVANLEILAMAVPGQKVVAQYVVENKKTDAAYKANVSVSIVVKQVVSGEEQEVELSTLPFTFTAQFDSGATTTINNDATDTLTVTVIMNKTLAASANYKIYVTLDATAVEN